MTRVLLVAATLLAAAPATSSAETVREAGAPSDAATGGDVAALIGELGSDQYAVRRHAEQELIRLGPDAFDELKLAEDSPDLEITERVRYILQRLRVEWIRDDDPAEVRRLLARYGELSESEKTARIMRLANLEGGAGLAALCRLARLEPRPKVARRAALAVIDGSRGPFRQALLESNVCDHELGGSAREPVRWIRLVREELVQPPPSSAAWDALIAIEVRLLAEESSDSDFATLFRLLRQQLAVCLELDSIDQTAGALRRIIDLDPEIGSDLERIAGLLLLLEPTPGARTEQILAAELGDDAELIYFIQKAYASPPRDFMWTAIDEPEGRQVAALYFVMQWTLDHRQWPIAEQLAQRYASQFKLHRGLHYYLAAAQSRASQTEQSTASAQQAFDLQQAPDEHDMEVAKLVAELGLVEWSIREYRRIVEGIEAPNAKEMLARHQLGTWHHDRQEHQAAAKALGAFCDALEDRAAKQKLLQELETLRRDVGGAMEIASFCARRQYYQAFLHESRGEFDQQRECLDKAAKVSRDDPDILIAMYRAPGADEAYKKQTLDRIGELSEQQLAEITQSPDDPGKYNQWAWLVSNTEGDYAKAVEYSRRSLELRPDEPSFLDTLGRCYYAAGDLENAVKTQRRAVELAPQYGVMRRQLEQFEKQYAAQRSK